MDALERARQLREQGAAARQDGDLERALALHLEAMEFFDQSGDWAWVARGCTSVAGIHALMSAPRAAEEWDRRALEAAEKSGDEVLRMMARKNLALDLCDLVQPDDAVVFLRDALRIAVDRGRQPQIYRAHHGLGYGLAQLGRWEDAVAELEESAAQQRDAGSEAGELATTLMELAGCYMEQGRRDAAIAVLEEACADFTSLGDEKSAEGCRRRLAELRES